MEITPRVRSTRFAQLEPGDLFIAHRADGVHVALAVKDPKANDQMVLLLGPASPTVPVPVLTVFPYQQTPVVSFAKDYKLRLPCDTKAWLAIEPSDECPCLVLAGDKLCMRALFGDGGRKIQCYIGIKDGLLVMDASGRFAYPSGDCAYTLDWAFLTVERDAREILSSPHAQ